MPHGFHTYAKAYYMEKATICAYPQSSHALPYCKFALRCCSDFPCINIPDQETYNQYSDTTSPIMFQICHIISRCTEYGRITLKDNKICHICKQESSSEKSKNIYTRKELVMMETTIYFFITVSIYQLSKSCPFVYHMCAYLVQITVLNYDSQPSNVLNYFNIFYIVLIMLRGWLQVLLIKYNQNIMVEIYQCL